MPCFFVFIGLLVPRVLIVLLYFFTTWFDAVFDTLLWPILGFIFLPTTLLWYSAVFHWFGGLWTMIPVIGLVIAIIIDLSPSGGAYRRY